MTDRQKEIIRLCISNGCCSIADISKSLNISIPTATKTIAELTADAYLEDLGKIGTKGGRRPNVFGLNPNAGYFIGVDVARQHFHIAISNFKGEIIKFIQDIEFVLESSADSFRSFCKRIVSEVEGSGIKWSTVLGVGVSLSGRVNPEKGYSLTYFVSDDIPMKSLFEKELGVPVTIENDSRAMAFGEYMHLARKDCKDMIFINLSWGLGMGIIMDGKLYYGKSGYSGEIGHFPLLNNDIVCRCGKVGCLETGASGSALHRIILEQIRSGRGSNLAEIYEKKGDVYLQDILQAIEDGDVLAIEGIEKVGETLGQGLAGIINIFNPSLVVIGGRLIVGKEYLMLPLRTAVNRFSLNKVSSDTKFMLSELNRKAASVGDCLLSRSKLLGLH